MDSQEKHPVLSFVDVDLSYYQSRSLLNRKKIQVLDKVSFDLYRGQSLGIIGRNGAGKSSLLRLMAGVLEPDSGTIIRHQADLHTSLLTLQLGFQSHLTGRENALLGCLLMGMSLRNAEQLLPEISAFSGLASVLDNPIASYSSGMRARLGFTVAYYTRADVMLIDEVLGVGDHEFKLKSRDALLSATASERTVVLVSHDEHFLAELCDELMWFEGGRLIMHGLPHNVLKKYHDYDHVISNLAFELGMTVEEARSDPNNRDPLTTIMRVKKSVKQERDELAGIYHRADSPVRIHHPVRHVRLSQVCRQECGGSCWVENTKIVSSGDSANVEKLYQRYEDLLNAISKITKTDIRLVRETRLVRNVLNLVFDTASSREKSGNRP